MANYVRISTIGPRPAQVDLDAPLDRVVDDVIEHWRGRIAQVLPDEPDLIVVPEVCDRPGNMPRSRVQQYDEARGDRVLEAFAGIARENGCYLTYPAVRRIAEDGTWRNSIRLLDRSGEVAGAYNKNHLVPSEHDGLGALYGRDAEPIECDFGRVGCAICFDLNFHEVRTKYVESRPDLIVFCSMYHGGLMQAYWAYSCRAHFVGAIAGPPSAIISPIGERLATTTNYFDFVTADVNLDCCVAHLDENWDRMRAMKERYGPRVKVTDPGHLGAVLIASETDEATAAGMVDEFEIELLDHYLERCMAHRHAPGHMES
jgi:predicted amidohydrolase